MLKKKRPLNLMVSIPRKLLQMQVCNLNSLCARGQNHPLISALCPCPYVHAYVNGRMSMLSVSLPWIMTSHIPLITVFNSRTPDEMPRYCMRRIISLPRLFLEPVYICTSYAKRTQILLSANANFEPLIISNVECWSVNRHSQSLN